MVVFLSNIPTPYRTAFFNTLSSTLKKEGVSLKVFYCAETEPRRHWTFDAKKLSYDFEILGGKSISVFGVTLHFNFNALKKIKNLEPEVIVLAGAWWTPTNIIFTLFYKGKAKLLFWNEGHESTTRIKKGLVPRLKKKALSVYDGFIVPNSKSKEWIQKILSSKSVDFTFLPNVIDDQYYKEANHSNSEALKEKLGVQSKTVFTQVSMLESWKGVQELVEAFVSIPKEKRKDIVLALVGDGSLFSEIKTRVELLDEKDSVILTGHLCQDEVRNWLSASDWFILNTKLDANPLTPIEASFCQKPIIISARAGNVSEVCVEGAGFIIEDPDNCIEALEKAISVKREVRVNMGLTSYINAENNFSREKVSSNFSKCLLNKYLGNP